ncbi:MAG TPA: hypothetical protein VIV14_00965, partial [Gammaproteobacteria bacterium]
MSAYQKWAGQGRAAGIPQSGSPQEHIYVAADAANADDNGPGTSAIPLATLNEAIQRVNLARITRPTIVHLATAPVNGEVAYAFTRQLGPIDLAAPLVFIGDGAGQPGDDGFTELLVDTVDAGASSTVVPVTGGGMGIDAFFGKTLELTSGTETGFRRTLNSNDATDLNLDAELANAPAQNDGLRIVEPAVRITVDQTFLGLTNARPTRSNIVGVGQGGGQLFGSGSGAQIVTSRAMLYFVNLALGGDTNLPSGLYELNVVDSAVCFLGCEWVG